MFSALLIVFPISFPRLSFRIGECPLMPTMILFVVPHVDYLRAAMCDPAKQNIAGLAWRVRFWVLVGLIFGFRLHCRYPVGIHPNAARASTKILAHTYFALVADFHPFLISASETVWKKTFLSSKRAGILIHDMAQPRQGDDRIHLAPTKIQSL